MERNGAIHDIDETKDRAMIGVFKNTIQERTLDPNLLEGSWIEASDLLVAHFGQLSSMMEVNRYKLLTLYQLSILELQTG